MMSKAGSIFDDMYQLSQQYQSEYTADKQKLMENTDVPEPSDQGDLP